MIKITDNSGASIANVSAQGAFVRSLKLRGLKIFYERPDTVRWRVRRGGSSVLIPYADLVKNGEYTYDNKLYRLPRNGKYEDDFLNSIHGTVLNKNWVVSQITSSSVTLNTNVSGPWFPSILYVGVNYSLRKSSFSTFFYAKNIGKRRAPLMCGAHPYLIYNKWWKISCDGKIKHLINFEQKKIETEEKRCDELNDIQQENFDEYYEGGGELRFVSKDRELKIERTNMPFFGIYNGKYCGGKSVNLKPLSSAPNCFNNMHGIINLEPNSEFSCGYRISLISN